MFYNNLLKEFDFSGELLAYLFDIARVTKFDRFYHIIKK